MKCFHNLCVYLEREKETKILLNNLHYQLGCLNNAAKNLIDMECQSSNYVIEKPKRCAMAAKKGKQKTSFKAEI